MNEKNNKLLKQFYQENEFVHFAAIMEKLSKENVIKLNSLNKSCSSEISSSINSASLNQQKRVNAVKRALSFNSGHVYTVPNHGQASRMCHSNINSKINKNVSKNKSGQESNDLIEIKKLQASGDYTLEYA
jgi:hypothetical protein